jgi:hypothetical protein
VSLLVEGRNHDHLGRRLVQTECLLALLHLVVNGPDNLVDEPREQRPRLRGAGATVAGTMVPLGWIRAKEEVMDHGNKVPGGEDKNIG